MINTHSHLSAELNIGGFTNCHFPQWVIQVLWPADRLTSDLWVDAEPYYYNPDFIPKTSDTSIKYNPEELSKLLLELKKLFPEKSFRLLIRVEVERVIG